MKRPLSFLVFKNVANTCAGNVKIKMLKVVIKKQTFEKKKCIFTVTVKR